MKIQKVSVVIVTHNEEKNIKDCLDSLQNLDYPKNLYEVIVVDSSKDKTSAIAKQYPDVKVYRTSAKGFSDKRNIGIEKANNELIAFTDADCIVPKDWLRHLIKRISNNVKCGAVCGNAYAPPNSPYIGKCISCLGTPAGGALGYDAVLKNEKKGISTIVTCNALFKKKVLKEAGMFDIRLKYGGEDSELSKRIRDIGYILEYEPNSFVYHKTRNNILDFFMWNIRRGKANYFVEKSSIPQILLFLPIWPIFLLFSIAMLIIIRQYFYALSVIIIFWAFSLLIFFAGSKRKAKTLLIKRRKIKIDGISIFVVIPILFYLRNIMRTLGEIIQWSSMKQ